jgi:threonine dehydrogenase-like Zn-dependent dehydrogenase
VPELPDGSVAYVDRDWLPASSAVVPALVADVDGELSWCGGPSVQIPSGHDSDTAAALTLLAIAQAAVAAAQGVPADSTEVIGSGLIALQVQALLGGSSSKPRLDRPGAIVETTGDPGAIVDATRRVSPLGTIVLVGESLERRTELNLYPDVHVRGLTLVGISPPLQSARAAFESVEADDELIESARKALAPAPAGDAALPDAVWYRVGG